jgi:hypothetical protein
MTETIEQAAERHRLGDPYNNFIRGATWQSERMYSEEDMIAFMQFIVSQESLGNTCSVSIKTAKYYLEQFKNK